MIELQIPGWGQLEIQHLVLDFNGTLATDGTLIEGVARQLHRLHEQGVNIYVITADTNGTVRKECEGLPVEVLVYDSATVAVNKMELVCRLGAAKTACIGNGRNDRKMFSASALSIAVLGEEGACVQSALQADVLVTSITQALELLLSPHRLKATLRG
jgi:soluble P-type ATPase